MVKVINVSILFCLLIITISCNNKNATENLSVNQTPLEVVKGQGTVKIGEMTWMSENLDVSVYRNGDEIPQAKSDEEWKNAKNNQQGAWCYFDNDPNNGKKYNKLYNWYAVHDPRGLAPEGWHVPSDSEWTKLTNYLGGKDGSGMKLKSESGWNGQGNGNNISGFNGMPGGGRFTNGSFVYMGEYGAYWSATESDETNAWFRLLGSKNEDINRYDFSKGKGMSVRCVKD